MGQDSKLINMVGGEIGELIGAHRREGAVERLCAFAPLRAKKIRVSNSF
jgi:hypothetical protein